SLRTGRPQQRGCWNAASSFARSGCRVVDDACEEDLPIAFIADGHKERMVDDHVEWRRLDTHGERANANAGGSRSLSAFFGGAEEGSVSNFADLQLAGLLDAGEVGGVAEDDAHTELPEDCVERRRVLQCEARQLDGAATALQRHGQL